MKLSKTSPTFPQIPVDEAAFAKSGRDVHGKVWKFSQSRFGDNVKAMDCGDKSFYYQAETKKTAIMLHHTIGFLNGDIAVLSKKDNHVSVSFEVARDGTVYQLFDPKYWSYHVGRPGPGALWTNTQLSKSTIGIEISNFGPLKKVGNKLIDIYGYLYCYDTDVGEYAALETPWRDFSYFATYTEAQYKAVDSLLLKLCREFNIPHTFLPQNERFDFSKKVPAVGIYSHCNVRADKSDVSTAFDFSKISGR